MFPNRDAIKRSAEPLIRSAAFRRLSSLSFLGILSPRYRALEGHPYATIRLKHDGSRAQHSLGVASIVLEAAGKLQLSALARRYAVAWALLHDIATWPLSHTGEAGFYRVADIRSRDLREAMIKGSYFLPRALLVFSPLKQLSLEHDVLLALFDKDSSGFDKDISALHELIHSPITPDTLEGMWRSGEVFGISVPHPRKVIDSLYIDVFARVMVDRRKSQHVLDFWRTKSDVYARHINSWESIEFESAWSRAIEGAHSQISLVDSLRLTEKQVIESVLSGLAPKFKEIARYKAPLEYVTLPELRRRRYLQQHLRLEDLKLYLVKTERA